MARGARDARAGRPPACRTDRGCAAPYPRRHTDSVAGLRPAAVWRRHGTVRGVARFPAGENADIRRSRCAPDAGRRRGGCEGGRGRTVHRGSLSPAGGGRRQPGAVGDRLPAGGFFRRTVCRRPGRTSPDRAGRAPVDPGTTPGDSRCGGAGYRTPQGAGGICAGRGNPVRQREHNPDRRAPEGKAGVHGAVRRAGGLGACRAGRAGVRRTG